MLDVFNTKSENKITNEGPYVQIVDPSNQNSYQANKAISSLMERCLKIEENRKHLFTIILNIHAGYKSAQFKQK